MVSADKKSANLVGAVDCKQTGKEWKYILLDEHCGTLLSTKRKGSDL